jgi:hypothetical protein
MEGNPSIYKGVKGYAHTTPPPNKKGGGYKGHWPFFLLGGGIKGLIATDMPQENIRIIALAINPLQSLTLWWPY